MSLRILIGHSLPGQRGSAHALYIGDSGAALEAFKATAPATIGSFTILNNPPGIRKSNPAYIAATAEAKKDAQAVAAKKPKAK